MARAARVGRAVAAHEAAFAVERDVFLEHLAVAQGEARRRQRVDHLVREQHAVPRLRDRAVEPFHQFEQQGRKPLLQPFALAFAQVRARLQQRIARRQGVEREQALERDLGERAAAAAELDQQRVGAELLQHRRDRVGDRGREQRAELGRGDEIPAHAELVRAGAVVAQAGRVQGEFHEARERDRAARGDDLFLHELAQALAVREGVGVGHRHPGHARRIPGVMLWP